MRLDGQAAIVTGGASGLGAATSAALARQGAKVAVVDLNQAAAEAVASRIGGGRIGHVTGQRQRTGIGSGEVVQRISPPRDQADVPACRQEFQRGGAANASTRPGDDDAARHVKKP